MISIGNAFVVLLIQIGGVCSILQRDRFKVLSIEPGGTISFSAGTIGNSTPANLLDTIAELKRDAAALEATTHETIENTTTNFNSQVTSLKNQLEDELKNSHDGLQEHIVTAIAEITAKTNSNISSLERRLTEKLDTVQIKDSNMPCNTDNAGVMLAKSFDGGCRHFVVCDGQNYQIIKTLHGPSPGRATCNPVSSCAETKGWGDGEYSIGTLGSTSQALCINGEVGGDGSIDKPALSCEQLFRFYPQKKKLGVATYYIKIESDMVDRTSFMERCADVDEYCNCPVGGVVRMGAVISNVEHFTYRAATTPTTLCSNTLFDGPTSFIPARLKYCECGDVINAQVHQRICSGSEKGKPDPRIFLPGLVGWWKAEDYNQLSHATVWPSINPREYFSYPSNASNTSNTSFHGVSEIPHIDPTKSFATITGAPLQIDQGSAPNAAPLHTGLAGHTVRKGLGDDGIPMTSIKFTPALSHEFAVCSITRYTQGPEYGRVLTSDEGQWLQGHSNARVGVVRYDNWLTYANRKQLHEYVVLCGSHASSDSSSGASTVYGNNGQRWTTWPLHGSGGDRYIGIGIGESTEYSHYSIAEIMIWNKALPELALRNTALYLSERLRWKV
eukprot:m.96651 g.96651  ORF g.96651 m.96651 type:complete len:615 (-) comp26911_c1_seq1:100-1944(-)